VVNIKKKIIMKKSQLRNIIRKVIEEQGPVFAPGPAGLEGGVAPTHQCGPEVEGSFNYWQGVDMGNIWTELGASYPYQGGEDNNLCGVYCGPAFAVENVGTPQSAWWPGFPNTSEGQFDWDGYTYSVFYGEYGVTSYCHCCLPDTVPTTQPGNPDHTSGDRPGILEPTSKRVGGKEKTRRRKTRAAGQKLRAIVAKAPRSK